MMPGLRLQLPVLPLWPRLPRLATLALCLAFLSGCLAASVEGDADDKANTDGIDFTNICAIYQAKPKWRKAAELAAKDWQFDQTLLMSLHLPGIDISRRSTQP